MEKEGDKSNNNNKSYRKLTISFFIPDKMSSTKQLQFPKDVLTNTELPSVINASISYIFFDDQAAKLVNEINDLRKKFEARVKGDDDIFDDSDLTIEKLNTNIRISQARLKLDTISETKYFQTNLTDI